jgi:hypothetical protein
MKVKTFVLGAFLATALFAPPSAAANPAAATTGSGVAGLTVGPMIEYPVPTPGSAPGGIVQGPDGRSGSQRKCNRIGRVSSTGVVTGP